MMIPHTCHHYCIVYVCFLMATGAVCAGAACTALALPITLGCWSIHHNRVDVAAKPDTHQIFMYQSKKIPCKYLKFEVLFTSSQSPL